MAAPSGPKAELSGLCESASRLASGETRLLGTPSSELNGHNFDRICYISESQKIPKWMSVEGFLKYCAGFYSNWDDALCQRLLETFALTPKQKIKHLSRGQLMKVAVTSTLPARPKLLLLDEPFSGLDVETRAQLSDLLKSLAHQDGLAIIITTHDVEEVEPVASRLAILNQGKLHINEPLDDYLARHRFIDLKGIDRNTLPANLRARVHPTRSGNQSASHFVDRFNTELESAFHRELPPESVEFTPMSIRQILTAHALPLS
jgi:ABC-2 type transport system ATP-binding protein